MSGGELRVLGSPWVGLGQDGGMGFRAFLRGHITGQGQLPVAGQSRWAGQLVQREPPSPPLHACTCLGEGSCAGGLFGGGHRGPAVPERL